MLKTKSLNHIPYIEFIKIFNSSYYQIS